MRFTETHEWIALEKEVGTVGITSFAQQELGEIVYVQLPEIGREVAAGEEIAVLESTKAAADIYAPVSGEVIAVNDALSRSTEPLNVSSEQEGWLFKIRIKDRSEYDSLLDRHQYQEQIR